MRGPRVHRLWTSLGTRRRDRGSFQACLGTLLYEGLGRGREGIQGCRGSTRDHLGCGLGSRPGGGHGTARGLGLRGPSACPLCGALDGGGETATCRCSPSGGAGAGDLWGRRGTRWRWRAEAAAAPRSHSSGGRQANPSRVHNRTLDGGGTQARARTAAAPPASGSAAAEAVGRLSHGIRGIEALPLRPHWGVRLGLDLVLGWSGVGLLP